MSLLLKRTIRANSLGLSNYLNENLDSIRLCITLLIGFAEVPEPMPEFSWLVRIILANHPFFI